MSTTTPAQLATEDKIDRRILHYIAQNPGRTEDAASRASGGTRARVEALIKRGLVRLQGNPEEGLPRGLYLTEEGWRRLEPIEGLALDMRIMLYIAENPGCKRSEAEAAGGNSTELTGADWYRRWRVNSFIQRGLVRTERRPNRRVNEWPPIDPRLHLTNEGRTYLFGEA